MRRLFIITELFPPDETSTSYILGEIANACAQEYEVHVICGPEVYDTRKKLDTEHPFVINPAISVFRAKESGFNKNKVVGKALSLIMMSLRLRKLAKSHIKNGDKVLLVTNPAPLVYFISRLKKTIGFEFVLLVHDVFPENLLQQNVIIPGMFYRLVKLVFDRAYAGADRLIALGRDMKKVLLDKTGQETKVLIVENWADTEKIKPVPFPSADVMRVEYAGNLGRAQKLDKLIANLPDDVELHVYGTGAMEQSLKGMHRPRVFFHGPYFRSQQNEVLGACHASIVSLSDSMYGIAVPSKSYNIMASGRPIIFFGPVDSEIALIVREHDIGYIGWPNAWDIDEMKRKGDKARIISETMFSKAIILKKFLDAIR